MNELKRYIIKKTALNAPDLRGRLFDPESEPFCTALNCARIDCYVWDAQGYAPEARAYAGWNAQGLQLLLCAREEKIQARETKCGGRVCCDSCLEFFVNPDPARQANYINIEINASGVAHIGLGAGRPNRRVLDAVPEGMRISASGHDGAWWAVSYALPYGVIESLTGGAAAEEMRGNFYTCDESIHPHFGSWSPVRSAQPDFHRPECFGTLKIER